MPRDANAGPSYFDGTKIGKTQKRFLYLAALIYVFDQADNGTFTYAVPSLIKNWGITTQQIAHINSLNYFGMFLGAVFGGWLAAGGYFCSKNRHSENGVILVLYKEKFKGTFI